MGGYDDLTFLCRMLHHIGYRADHVGVHTSLGLVYSDQTTSRRIIENTFQQQKRNVPSDMCNAPIALLMFFSSKDK